jgi:hypothetical protein
MKAPQLGLCFLAMFLCTACEQLPIARRAPPPPPSAPVAAAPAPEAPRATPIAAHDISLAGTCRRTEDDGFREDAVMRVVSNDVKSLKWKLWVSKRGTCQFDLADFKQVQKTPHIVLEATDGTQCKLLIWQDPRRVTLAHANCQQRCTPGIYEQAWPVLFNPRNGACAEIR